MAASRELVEPRRAGCRRTPAADDATVLAVGRSRDVARLRRPTDSATALPVQGSGLVRGRFLLIALTRIAGPTPQAVRVALPLASPVGAALTALAGGS
jgi:hypothetical protein